MKIQWLYNPFLKIAGGKSLFWGVIILFGTSLLGFINNVHYDGIIDVHSGMPAPFYIFIGETALSWIIFSLLLFVTATIFSTSKVRIIDFFGTQAFAKYPYLLISLLSFIPFFKYEYKGFPEITISILIFANCISVNYMECHFNVQCI